MKTLKRKIAAIALVVMVAASALSISYLLVANLNKGVTVIEGAFLLSSSSDRATVRILSPNASVIVKDFSGRITFENCFPGCAVKGYSGQIERNGTMISLSISTARTEIDLVAEQYRTFSFAVVGDSQGHNDVLGALLKTMSGCDFVLHCGDLTPSATSDEYVHAEETLNESPVPVMVTPGNHDIRNNGVLEFEKRFGPTRYCFTYGNVTFAFVDSSDMSISEDDLHWMEGVFKGATHKIIVTHAPSYDPFGGNHTLDAGSSDRIQQFALKEKVDAVFSGHIHAYSMLDIDGTAFVITGGAGGSLVNGSFHFVRVNVTAGMFSYQEVDLSTNITEPADIVVNGHGTALNLSYAQLFEMQQTFAESSYQNLYGNIGPVGNYSGVLVSALVDLVGGMNETEMVNITCSDGYYQTFGYLNIYPNQTWLQLQGKMILGLEYNGTPVPEWQDGPRIAMLPDDGLYNNSDCDLTSYPGQGYSVYPSAGARWAKNVVEISVEG
jgi:predicted phosphodiesterase